MNTDDELALYGEPEFLGSHKVVLRHATGGARLTDRDNQFVGYESDLYWAREGLLIFISIVSAPGRTPSIRYHVRESDQILRILRFLDSWIEGHADEIAKATPEQPNSIVDRDIL